MATPVKLSPTLMALVKTAFDAETVFENSIGRMLLNLHVPVIVSLADLLAGPLV